MVIVGHTTKLQARSEYEDREKSCDKGGVGRACGRDVVILRVNVLATQTSSGF